MIIYIWYPSGYRNQFKVSSVEDFSPLAAMFPQVNDIVSECFDLKEAAQEVALYISNGGLDAWVEQDGQLSKGNLKKKLLHLVWQPHLSCLQCPVNRPLKVRLLILRLISPPSRQLPTRKRFPIRSRNFGKAPEDKFLWSVMQAESSGGHNLAHPEIKVGISKGQRPLADGVWWSRPLMNSWIASGYLVNWRPEHQHIAEMNRDQLEQYFKLNPHIELNFARDIARHVISRQGGDLNRSAYAWLYGHNLHPSDITDDHVVGEPYVGKVMGII